jgi:PAS domain S-box-containing protein
MAIFDYLGEISIVVSAKNQILNINKSFFDFLQYSEEELIGQSLPCILPGLDLSSLLNRTTTYIPYTDTFLFNKAQVQIPVSVSASALLSENEELMGIWLTIQSNKGRNQIKISLEDIEKRYLSMTQNALDAVIVMNSEGKVIEWNHQAEVQFGWTEQEALDVDLADLIIPEKLRDMHRKGIRRFMTTGVHSILNKRIELSALHKMGHELPVELTVSPIKWADTYLFTAFVRDITVEKLTEKELVKAKEAAELATQAKSDFLATMSHEIRTPLNGIIGLSHLLKETQLNAEQFQYVDFMIKSENSLLSIINNILDFSKIESGKITLEQAGLDIKTCMDDTIAVMEVLARAKSLDLTYSIDPEVPNLIMGDIWRLRQILINLVGNAIKFTQSGGVHVSISEANEHPQKKIKFTVKDTGIGITKEQVQYLFEPFTQFDSSTTRKFGGTGLGLAITKNLIELMHGNIWVEESEIGASFCFTIAYQTMDDQHQGEDYSNQVNAAEKLSAKILIAEDNEINQMVLLKMLEKEGYQADIANNGAQVLDALGNDEYDLIFMDIHMPEMDGVAVTKKIKELFPPEAQPRIIAVTADAFESDRERYMAMGMQDYISKPIRWEQLRRVIQEHLS